MAKRPAGETSDAMGQTKILRIEPRATLLLTASPHMGPSSMITDEAKATALLPRQIQRASIEPNPAYLKRLEQRGEIGFRRLLGKKKLAMQLVVLDVSEFRRCIQHVLQGVLQLRYHSLGSYRNSEISAEIEEIVPLTADMCMSALYARLRSIHKSYGKYATRYSTAPCYTKDVELPLPLALAIEQIGSFETHSLETNTLVVPTYPEGTKNEGRRSDEYQVTEYLAYIPTFKELGIPCKAVDTRLKTGTAWWTYKVRNLIETTDLICLLPPSHYSDLSAQLRACFLAEVYEDPLHCKDIIAIDEEAPTFGTKFRELPIGYNIRVFLALCHGPEEEWSHGM